MRLGDEGTVGGFFGADARESGRILGFGCIQVLGMMGVVVISSMGREVWYGDTGLMGVLGVG